MAYTDFIPQNVAPQGARRIGIYNEQGNRVGQIPLGSLTPPFKGRKLYSFGALSDVHLQYSTAQTDFQRALTYLNEQEDVAFTCVCGDLTSGGTAEQMSAYKAAVDEYSPDTPVYAVSGNHESWGGLDLTTAFEQYTGNPLYYSFTHGNDVFVMVGFANNTDTNIFTDAELEWLAETLEANKDKRVFLFEHVRPQDGCGNALGLYKLDLWNGTQQTTFENLLRQYPNIVLFHGHSHLKFYLQTFADDANIDKLFGCWSVHIPSIAVPRDTDGAVDPTAVDVYADSEGYVVDVYENGIHLRGRDFVKGEFLPIASYWLDTIWKDC